MNSLRSVLFSAALFAAVITSVPSASQQNPDIQSLIDQVPVGASWQDLSGELRAAFAANAAATLARYHREWGLSGLNDKLDRLLKPTDAMRATINRVLGGEFASELPDGFVIDRDVTHDDLKTALLRIYLIRAKQTGSIGWDGTALKEFHYADHEHYRAMRVWSEETQRILQSIDQRRLTPVEQAILRKGQYRLRRHRFDAPHVAAVGDPNLGYLYTRDAASRPFATDTDLLNAYNASMFSEVRSVDRGSLVAFVWNYEAEFDEIYLKEQGMPDKLVTSILKLGNLYKTRTLAHEDQDKRCTLYSATDRAKTWDALTASLISNADGTETMESYAKLYQTVAQRRAAATRELAKATLDAIVPPNSPELDSTTRAAIKRALDAETRPAAILDTLRSELNKHPGGSVAASTLDAALKQQVTVGGGYDSGGAPRKEDEQQILEMWQTIRAYLQREYRGYADDIAARVPDRPILLTALIPSSSYATPDGAVSIGLKSSENKAILYAILLHEIKHAIDFRSGAIVEGAAWEGAAVAVMRGVWPRFIDEAMPGDAVSLAIAKLVTDIFNVRFTAGTDATLQVFLRQSCDASEPDTIDFAKKIIAGYGYDDENALARSKSAHNDSYMLTYDYGLTMYTDLMDYLQAGVGAAPRVDPFLLQACRMPSPKKDEASVKRLKACLAARRN